VTIILKKKVSLKFTLLSRIKIISKTYKEMFIKLNIKKPNNPIKKI